MRRALPGTVRLLVLSVTGDGPLPVPAPDLGWLRSPSWVSVGVLRGRVSGWPLAVACAADLRLAASDATLAVPDLPTGGLSWTLVQLLGYPRALEVAATGRALSAGQAEAWGLVELVVAPAEVDSAVADLAAALLAGPPETLAETKALLRAASPPPPTAHLAAETAAAVRLADPSKEECSPWT
ncbi:MAG: enoyl-CoA hydratase/isomerase family protein [Mycobacteriales bacterium]